MNHHILVVDDDTHVREALVAELGKTYQVDTASCGSDAFDALATRRYDVIISDLRMPDHDGIEVLEFARQHQGDAVRILLTGYLDEHTRRALLTEDAPFKVGKPWHDEIEVVVRRGLEHRELSRRMSASVADALDLARFDQDLAATTTPGEVAGELARRAAEIDGVTGCAIVAPTGRVVTGALPVKAASGWALDLSLGELRVHTTGIGDGARQLMSYLVHRAQRHLGVIEARVPPAHEPTTGHQRTNLLVRQATIGAMTSSLLHDLASVIQAMTGALQEVAMLAEEAGIPGLPQAIEEATGAGDEAVGLFVAMRKFIRAGDVSPTSISASEVVERAKRLAGGYIEERATLAVAAIPDVRVTASEALFLQVVVNLLRNAANASPAGGTVDLVVTATDTEVTFMVTDDGPGVDPAILDTMFEPFASTSKDGTGLGLAISAHVMQLHQGALRYRRAPGRGACFTATVPRAP